MAKRKTRLDNCPRCKVGGSVGIPMNLIRPYVSCSTCGIRGPLDDLDGTGWNSMCRDIASPDAPRPSLYIPTRRDYFAARIAAGTAACDPEAVEENKMFAKYVVGLADAVIAELNKGESK